MDARNTSTDMTARNVPTDITVQEIPSSVFQALAVFAPNGTLDARKSAKLFEEKLLEWAQTQAEMKPAIIAELREYKRLGEANLIAYTLHALHLPKNKENIDRVSFALQELERSGKIAYQTTESGQRRGRNAGWVLVGAVGQAPSA